MGNKISSKNVLTSLDNADKLVVMDVSDTTDGPSGTLKTITKSNLGISGGSGDASTDTSSSVDSEVALFSGTGGKTLKRATGSGLAKLTSGVLSTASAGTDYYAPSSTDVAVADGGTGASDASGARTNLGLVIGTNVQAYDAQLTDVAAITPSKGKLLYTDASNILALAAGTDGHVLTLDSATSAGIKWAAPSGGGAPTSAQYLTLATDATLTNERTVAFDDNLLATDAGAGSTYTISQKTARRRFYLYTDMIGGATNTDYINYNQSGTGAAHNVFDHDDTTAAGVVQSSTGTTTSGHARMYFAAVKVFRFATTNKFIYETRVKLDQLSDGTNTFQLLSGFNQSSTAEGTDGVYFSYRHDLNSGKFEIVTKSNGSATRTDTGTTVSSATWYNLRLEVLNVSGTLTVRGYINGSQVGGDITSNIPNGSGRGVGFAHLILKSAGTTACTMQTDYLEIIGYFDSNR